MGIIRPYAGLPRAYVADVGEVILARLSAVNPYARAVVTSVSRRREGVIRYGFVWLDTQERTTAVRGERSHVYVKPGEPPLIKQIDKGSPVGL